jgi:hypothetical protein
LTATLYLVLLIAIIGLIVYAVASDLTAKAAIAKAGEVLMWAGTLAFLFEIASRVIRF